jgi:hypothetical protein
MFCVWRVGAPFESILQTTSVVKMVWAEIQEARVSHFLIFDSNVSICDWRRSLFSPATGFSLKSTPQFSSQSLGLASSFLTLVSLHQRVGFHSERMGCLFTSARFVFTYQFILSDTKLCPVMSSLPAILLGEVGVLEVFG